MPKLDALTTVGLVLNNLKNSPTGELVGPTESWQLVALSEILQELKRLNALLHCQNFQDIPRKLDRIERNTRKRKRKPVRKVAVPALRVINNIGGKS